MTTNEYGEAEPNRSYLVRAHRILAVAASFAVVLTVVLAFLLPPDPRAQLVGLWRGESGYIFIQDNSYTVFTGIAGLHNSRLYKEGKDYKLRVVDEVGDLTYRLDVGLGTEPGIDVLKVRRPEGGSFLLERTRMEKLHLLESLSSYSKSYFLQYVLYPDGVVRLAALYFVSSVVAAVLLSSQFHRPREFEALLVTAVFWLAVLLLSPVVLGYLFGAIRWIYLGWWDPLRVGRAVIYSVTGILFCLLAVPIAVLRGRLKGNRQKWLGRGGMRTIFAALLLILDLLGITLNLMAIVKWMYE